MELNKIVSENIRGIMHGNRETVQVFCEACGISKPAFYSKCRGKSSWNLKEMQFVCERYHVSPERLIAGFKFDFI